MGTCFTSLDTLISYFLCSFVAFFVVDTTEAIQPAAEQTFGLTRGLTERMRILKGLSSRRLPCGCLVGIYETYHAEVVVVLDSRGDACSNDEHVPGRRVHLEAASQHAGQN